VIYVDSNVPMYLVGAAHPNKDRVVELVSQLLTAREVLVTSAETFQEILHRYTSKKDPKHLAAAYEALEALVSRTVEVTKNDADSARSLLGRYPSLSSRDAVHVAVMERLRVKKIWSFDGDFDTIPSIVRVR
jgi:predicted nucleic acid-binding protein